MPPLDQGPAGKESANADRSLRCPGEGTKHDDVQFLGRCFDRTRSHLRMPAPLLTEKFDDFFVVGEATDLVLGEDELAIHDYIEHAVGTFYEF